MRKYLLSSILFASIGYCQDVMVFKKGAVYNGEFLGVKSDVILFKPANTQIMEVDKVKIRSLKQEKKVLVQDGKWKANSKPYIIPDGDYSYYAKVKPDISKKEDKCEKNSEIRIVMIPISNDFYGLSDLLHNEFDSVCFDIKSNMSGLKYLDSKDLLSENINDFHLNEIGKSSDVDYVSHGFAYTIDIPNKSSQTSVATGLAASSIWRSDNPTSLFESLPSAISHYGNVKNQSMIAEQAGTYLLVTYYLYNMRTGKKEFVYQNTIIKKLG